MRSNFLRQKSRRFLMSVLNCVPYVPSCLTCPRPLRALMPYVPSCLTCPRALHALVPCMSYVSCMPSCLACLTYLTCPRGLRALKFIQWAASEIVGLIVQKVALDSSCWDFQIGTTQRVNRKSTEGTK